MKTLTFILGILLSALLITWIIHFGIWALAGRFYLVFIGIVIVLALIGSLISQIL